MLCSKLERMNTTFPVKNLHLEYQLWIIELNFDIELLRIFEQHLEHIVSKIAGKDCLAKIEHLQNQFICQCEVIDELKHDLNISEKQLAAFASQRRTVGFENERLDNHAGLRDRFLTVRKIFDELKAEFRLFESQCN